MCKCGSFVVKFIVFDWYMARFVGKDGHQKDSISYDWFGLVCVPNVLIDDLIFNSYHN